MGQFYIAGNRVAKDTAKGLSLLKSAADTGKRSDAALVLAKLYTAGGDVPADPVLASQYLLQAANARNAEAQYLMAEHALNQPTPDVKEGVSWLQSAAVLGYGKAQYALGEQYLKDTALVNAYVWFYFAAQKQIDGASQKRDDLAAKLTPDQMSHAQTMETSLESQFPNI